MLHHRIESLLIVIGIALQKLHHLLIVPKLPIIIKFVLIDKFAELSQFLLLELIVLDLPVVEKSRAVLIE